MTKEINNKFTNYNYNIQSQMVDLLDQYKNFLSQNKPVVQSQEAEREINDFIADLDTVEEQDIELEKEIQNVVNNTEAEAESKPEMKLPTINEEDLEEVSRDLDEANSDDELPTIEDDESEQDETEEVEEEVEEVEEDESKSSELNLDLDVSENESVEFEAITEPTPVELPPRCSFIFKRGKNKGNQCERKSGEDGMCSKHSGK